MRTITYSKARQKLASEMTAVVKDRAPVMITRKKDGGAVVMMSRDDYESMKETAYLLRSPANARRLMESVAAVERGAVRDVDIDISR